MIGLSVLVVEGEHRDRRGQLVHNLRSDGFRVTTASTLDTCLEQLAEANPAIVLIDVDLPDSDGLEACHQVRLRSQIPIIAIADPDSPIDAITTLELGADDHVLRPYRPSELIARIRAALRRATPSQALSAPHSETAITIGHVTLDPAAHSVHIDGRPAQLPLKEFELLHLLMINAGRVLTREALLRRIWHREAGGDTKTLDVHIKRIRHKIDIDGGHASMIVTVRGLGYKLDPADRRREPRHHGVVA